MNMFYSQKVKFKFLILGCTKNTSYKTPIREKTTNSCGLLFPLSISGDQKFILSLNSQNFSLKHPRRHLKFNHDFSRFYLLANKKEPPCELKNFDIDELLTVFEFKKNVMICLEFVIERRG